MVVSAASLSLTLYAFGVFFGALSMWCSGQASARFAFMWEAYLDKDRPAKPNGLTREISGFMGTG